MPKNRSFFIMTKVPLQNNCFSMQKIILRKIKYFAKNQRSLLLYCKYHYFHDSTDSFTNQFWFKSTMCFAKSSQTLSRLTLHEKCLYSDFFWSAFSRIRIEHGDLLCKFSYLDRIRENTDQKNSEFEHLLRSVSWEDFFHCFHDSYCS